MSEIFEVDRVEGYVYCDLHGEVHEECTNPYDGPPERHENGRPVWMTVRPVMPDGSIGGDYSHEWARSTGSKLVPLEPACTSENWTSLYHSEGGYEGPVEV